MIPVRCFSCNKPVGHLAEEYNTALARGEDRKAVLERLGLKRYCCRQIMLGHV
ncbi:DNA-directed RNA polymerase subunit N, partial [Candidatus Woesearchaeota archaeon]|nr:DNA-directed RNA polymerase subunit N [Candidatus Woesearchaeota archaeon]